MNATYSLPSKYLPALGTIVELADQLEPMIASIGSLDKSKTLNDVIAQLKKMTGLDEKRLREVLDALALFHSIGNSHALTPADLYASLTERLETIATSEWKQQFLDGWKRNHKSLTYAIDSDNPFGVFYKIINLTYTHQNIVQDLRLISDIRPVFNREGNKILDSTVGHSLVINYTDGGPDRKTIHFSLDDSDLSELQKICTRSAAKAALIRNAQALMFDSSTSGSSDK